VEQVYGGVKTGPKYLRDLQKTIPIWYKIQGLPCICVCVCTLLHRRKKIKGLTAQYLVKCSKIRKLIWHLIVILQKFNKVFQRKEPKSMIETNQLELASHVPTSILNYLLKRTIHFKKLRNGTDAVCSKKHPTTKVNMVFFIIRVRCTRIVIQSRCQSLQSNWEHQKCKVKEL